MRLAIALAAALMLAPAASAQDLLIRGARVFDGDRMLGVRDVLVTGGRIARVDRNITAPAGATTIDANGKTLYPGLIDAHTHTFQDVLRQALAFGVTTQLEMFTEPRMAAMWRQEQAQNRATDRADVFSAGVMVTAPGGHGTQFGIPIPTITSPDSAQSFVDARIGEGSDYIKIVYDDGAAYALRRPTIDKPTLQAVVEAAHRRGKLAVVHVHSGKNARDALEVGADGLVHIFADRDEAVDAEVVRLAVAKKAFVIPTLTVNQSVTGVAGGTDLLTDPRIRPLLTRNDSVQLTTTFPTRPGAPARYVYAESIVTRLEKAGVPILAGTDAPNPGTTHGASMHGEMDKLVQVGLTPAEALTAATANVARAFRLADRGRIAAGLRADLVLVDGDPTRDIRHSRAITHVWKGGVPFDRTAHARRVAATWTSRGNTPAGIGSGEIASFDDGATASRFGSPWEATTDQMAGGKSAGAVNVVDGGANGSAKALRISGTIDPALPYAWAGAAFGPGSAPMQPTDLSSKKELVFHTRGDGKNYRVMIFAQSRGMTPLVRPFQASSEWREVVLPFSAFGTDGKDILLIIIAGGPAAGPFELFVDEIRVR